MGLVLVLLDGPVVSAVLWTPGGKFQGANPLFRSICSGSGSFFSSCKALRCCSQPEKSLMGLIISKQLLNVHLFIANIELLLQRILAQITRSAIVITRSMFDLKTLSQLLFLV